MNKIQCMISSPQKKKCDGVGLGEEVLFDLAQLLQDKTYLQKQKIFAQFAVLLQFAISRQCIC